MFVAFHETEKAISAKRLHEALHRTKPQVQIEVVVNSEPVFQLPSAIVCEQLGSLCFGKIDIRIVKQRSQIVFRQAGSHSLEIDEVGVPVLDDDVLGLKIAMHQNPWQTRKTFCDFAQSWKHCQLFAF